MGLFQSARQAPSPIWTGLKPRPYVLRSLLKTKFHLPLSRRLGVLFTLCREFGLQRLGYGKWSTRTTIPLFVSLLFYGYHQNLWRSKGDCLSCPVRRCCALFSCSLGLFSNPPPSCPNHRSQSPLRAPGNLGGRNKQETLVTRPLQHSPSPQTATFRYLFFLAAAEGAAEAVGSTRGGHTSTAPPTA